MKIELIGFPMFYGCDKKGVEEGPDQLRKHNLMEIFTKNHNEVIDYGNIDVEQVGEDRKYKSHPSMKYYKEIIEANHRLAQAVEESMVNGRLPFIIGGDHSQGIGSLAGVKAGSNEDFAVIWVDAHADLNITETSPSGNIHGMPLSASAGLGDAAFTSMYQDEQKIKPENIYIIGLRSVDEGEEVIIKEYGVNVWRMEDIRQRSMEACTKEILEMIEKSNIQNIHLSYDIDSLDSRLVPGAATPVKNGLEIEESQLLVSSIIETKKVKSIDFVEFNPVIDQKDATLHSALTMLETFSSSLGKL